MALPPCARLPSVDQEYPWGPYGAHAGRTPRPQAPDGRCRQEGAALGNGLHTRHGQRRPALAGLSRKGRTVLNRTYMQKGIGATTFAIVAALIITLAAGLWATQKAHRRPWTTCVRARYVRWRTISTGTFVDPGGTRPKAIRLRTAPRNGSFELVGGGSPANLMMRSSKRNATSPRPTSTKQQRLPRRDRPWRRDLGGVQGRHRHGRRRYGHFREGPPTLWA